MKTIQSSSPTKLAIVCCMHGDERYGLEVFNYFKDHLSNYPGLKLIIANEQAVDQDVRFIERDLNHCFPGDPEGNLEERLAHDLTQELKDVPFVLDIHTTTSDQDFLAIIVSFDDQVKKLISHTQVKNIALIKTKAAAGSLIGNVQTGVSLEYGRKYAKLPSTLQETIQIVDNFYQNNTTKKPRNIFHVDGKLEKSLVLPSDVANYKLIESIQVYPILLFEKAYQDRIYGMSASKRDVLEF